MGTKTYATDQALRILPLLHSIGRELAERGHAIEDLKDALARARRGGPRYFRALRDLRARLEDQRREVARALRELEALGCRLDDDHPLRILIPGSIGTMAYEATAGGARYRFVAERLEI